MNPRTPHLATIAALTLGLLASSCEVDDRAERCEAAELVVLDRPRTLTGKLGANVSFVGSELEGCSFQDGAEVLYRLRVEERTGLQARVSGAKDLTLQLRRDCLGEDFACAPSTEQELELDLDPGEYLLIIDSRGGTRDYTLELTPGYATQTMKCEAAPAIPADGALFQHTGDTRGQTDTFRPSCDIGRGGDESFRIDTSGPTRIVASAYNHQDWAVLQLSPSCDGTPVLSCDDETAILFSSPAPARVDARVDAGTYFLIVDSESQSGDYTLAVRATPFTTVNGNGTCESAYLISGGAVSGVYGNANDDVAMGCAPDAGQRDVHFKLSLTETSAVALMTDGYETISIRPECGAAELACSRKATTEWVLDAGTWVVSLERQPGIDFPDDQFWLVADIRSPDAGTADGGP